MKSIINFLNEALINKNSKITKKIKDDPNTWSKGDILTGTSYYSMIIPYFFKILKRTDKSFTLIELSEKVVKGHYNGTYWVVPNEDKFEQDLKKGKPINVRYNKYGRIVVKRNVTLKLWDGEPQEGCDLD